jgi:hypothetical protein
MNDETKLPMTQGELELLQPLTNDLDAAELGAPDALEEERVRGRTLSRKQMTRDLRRQLREGTGDPDEQELRQELEATRPRTRAECADGPRPCLFVSCKHHLYLDVNPRTGSVKLNFPDKELWELPETCALDVADRGGITLEEVGAIMNLTRERVRQVETRGIYHMRVLAPHELGGDDDLDE